MRAAVLADIHGNLPALEAVLGEVASASVDVIVLNGDLADGPMPAETLDRLEELGERAIWVRGNTDRWLAEAFDGTFTPSGLPTNPPAEYFAHCPNESYRVALIRAVVFRLVRGQDRVSSPGPARQSAAGRHRRR
jgi:putative phosphoesterase